MTNKPEMVSVPRELLECIAEKDLCNRTLGELMYWAREVIQRHDDAPPEDVRAVVDEPTPEKYDEVLMPFLAMMRAELHANAHKGDRPGWLSMDGKTAILEVFYHMGKLHQAVHRGEDAAIREYAADVANMCMMLTDVCGCIDEFSRLNPEISK